MEENKVTDFPVLLIGGSAGSLEVLMQILPLLKVTLSGCVILILHRKSAEDMTLETLVSVKTALPVVSLEDKTRLYPGHIYIAPSDYHLLFEKNGLLSLDISEKINYSRPSIDVSFESAAQAYGNRVIGILLSGANADGTQGLIAIKEFGGKTLVQDPKTAEIPYMPQYAIDNAQPDAVLNWEELVVFINAM